MESDARELCCFDGVFKDMLLRVTEKLIQSAAETVMGDRYTHIPPAPTSTAAEPSSTTARGAAVEMIIKTGITHSIAMRVNGDDGLPCNPLGDNSGDSSNHRCNCIIAKAFDHSPGGVTCTGISCQSHITGPCLVKVPRGARLGKHPPARWSVPELETRGLETRVRLETRGTQP